MQVPTISYWGLSFYSKILEDLKTFRRWMELEKIGLCGVSLWVVLGMTLCHLLLLFFFRYFLYLHFKCYPKSSLYPPSALLPYPPTPTSWPWHSPVLGHIKFAIPQGLSSQWWPTRPSSATYAAREMSSGGAGYSSHFCFTYRVADPFSCLGVFSSVSIGGPVFHPIDDCEHPLLDSSSL